MYYYIERTVSSLWMFKTRKSIKKRKKQLHKHDNKINMLLKLDMYSFVDISPWGAKNMSSFWYSNVLFYINVMHDLSNLQIFHLAPVGILVLLWIQKECIVNWDVKVNRIIYYIINHILLHNCGEMNMCL